MSHPYFELPTPLAIGHRGCAGKAPENTLASFELALAEGAVILESDVHLTRDGVPVLIHDPAVDRVTDGSGLVADYPLEALQRLDAGHHFSPDGGATHPFRGRGLRIPSLADAFDALPGARFNLELKSAQPGMVDAAVDLVVSAGQQALTLLTAADDGLMQALRARLASLDEPIAQGASTADVLDFVRTALDGGTPAKGPMALQIPADFGGRPLVTRELVAHAHAGGVQVHVWTINDAEQMRELLALGVDGIISDFPGRVAEVIAAHERTR